MMSEVHEKKPVLSLRSTESKVGVCIAGTVYFFSLSVDLYFTVCDD